MFLNNYNACEKSLNGSYRYSVSEVREGGLQNATEETEDYKVEWSGLRQTLIQNNGSV